MSSAIFPILLDSSKEKEDKARDQQQQGVSFAVDATTQAKRKCGSTPCAVPLTLNQRQIYLWNSK